MKSKFLRIIMMIFLLFFCISLKDKPIMAAPSRHIPITVTQPSGEKLKATLHGDEKFNWWTAGNGDVVTKCKNGYWYYANVVSGKIQASQSRYLIDKRPLNPLQSEKVLEMKNTGKLLTNDTDQNMQAVPVKSGLAGKTHKILVILVEFQDIKIQNSDTKWGNEFFNLGQDSVNSYYNEVSESKFLFRPAEESSDTSNDGVIKVTLDYNHPDTGEDVNSMNQKIVADALIKANSYIDYSSFDSDGNGYISTDELHIITIVAGYEASYGTQGSPSVWGHRWSLDSTSLSLDGVGLCNSNYNGGYTQQGEIQGDHMATIGVLCHELGHDLGLPDLYDYDDSSLGVGIHSLMAGGSWGAVTGYDGSSPTHLDAWCRIELGFAVPQTVTEKGDYTVNSVLMGSIILKVPTDDPSQYFLVENREFQGFDRSLSSCVNQGGIAIWHIDDSVIANANGYGVNDNEYHKGVDLEEANEGTLGYSQLDRKILWPKYDHYYYLGGVSVFGPSTKPGSRLYDGSDTGIEVSIKSPSSSSMNVNIIPSSTDKLDIIKISPGDYPKDAPKDITASVQFNKIINKGINFNKITYINESGKQIDYTAAIDGDTLYIKPVNALDSDTGYLITIPSGAIADDSGSSYSKDIYIGFTTIDDIAPSVVSTYPADGCTDISTDSSIYINFSEEIGIGTSFDNILLKNSTGEIVPTNSSIDYNRITLQPLSPLQEGNLYTVVVPQYSITDKSGNEFGSDYSFKFITYAPNFIHIRGIRMNTSSIKLGLNQEQKLSYTITPLNATCRNVEWKTSNEAVVQVSSDGIIKAVGKGTAVVTVKAIEGGYEALCRVTVIPVESIKISRTSLSIRPGCKTKLYGYISPYTAVNKGIMWESEDNSIAAVDSKGYITALADGKTIIYARSKENNEIFAQCSVTVETPVISIKLNKTAISISTTQGYNTARLFAEISPQSATNKGVEWKSSDDNIVKVDQSGIITAVGPGKAVITAVSLGGGKTAKCSVTVAPVTEVKLIRSQMNLGIGKYTILKPIIFPSSAAVKDVIWEVAEGQSVIVTKYGKIIGIKEGTSKIRVTTADGGYSFECEITVTGETKVLVNSITLANVATGRKTGIMPVGKSAYVRASVSGESRKIPTNKNLLWSSSDGSIAWVDDNGRVFGVSPGKVTITASATDGSGVEKSVEIEVVQPIKSLALEKTIYLKPNQLYEIKGLLLPTDITEDGITVQWIESDRYGSINIEKAQDMTIDSRGNLITSLIERDDNGLPYVGLNITAIKNGTAKLYLSITTKDGSRKTASCTIRIE